MLDLIEHLASGVRDVPLLILCLARPELLDERPGWGGGKVRATSIELEPLPRDEGGRLVDALAQGEAVELTLASSARPCSTRRTGTRSSSRRRCGCSSSPAGEPTGIPPTVQAMIAARIDRLPAAERKVLRRAAVAGRTFWSGAVEAIGEDSDPVEMELQELVERDFLVREPRSTIRGEEAFRFKHVLIRDVAYAGLPKASRALLHRQMAAVAARAQPRRRARRDPGVPPRPRRGARGGASGRGAGRARGGGGGSARAGGTPGARARGECRRAPPARPGGGARGDARAALPGRECSVADDRHPDGLDGDGRDQRRRARGGRCPHRGPGADRARQGRPLPRRRHRLRPGARGPGARRRRRRTTTGHASTRSRCSGTPAGGRETSRRSSGSRRSGSRSRSGWGAATSRRRCSSSSRTSTTSGWSRSGRRSRSRGRRRWRSRRRARRSAAGRSGLRDARP